MKLLLSLFHYPGQDQDQHVNCFRVPFDVFHM